MDIPHRKPPHQAKIQSFGPNPTPARGMYYIGVDHNDGNTIYYNGIFNGICSMYLIAPPTIGSNGSRMVCGPITQCFLFIFNSN